MISEQARRGSIPLRKLVVQRTETPSDATSSGSWAVTYPRGRKAASARELGVFLFISVFVARKPSPGSVRGLLLLPAASLPGSRTGEAPHGPWTEGEEAESPVAVGLCAGAAAPGRCPDELIDLCLQENAWGEDVLMK